MEHHVNQREVTEDSEGTSRARDQYMDVHVGLLREASTYGHDTSQDPGTLIKEVHGWRLLSGLLALVWGIISAVRFWEEWVDRQDLCLGTR